MSLWRILYIKKNIYIYIYILFNCSKGKLLVLRQYRIWTQWLLTHHSKTELVLRLRKELLAPVVRRLDNAIHQINRVYLGVKTSKVCLCFVAIVMIRVYYFNFFVFFILRHSKHAIPTWKVTYSADSVIDFSNNPGLGRINILCIS